MIHIPIDHLSTRLGYNRPGIGVDLDDDGGFNVVLSIDAQSERDDDAVDRTLTPQEARALSAALWHYADEAGRRP